MSTPSIVFMEGFIKGYARRAMYIQDITRHPSKHIIEHRLKVIAFFDDYGAEAAFRAFGVSRATIFSWKKRLKAHQGRLSSLAPGSRRPHTMRSPADYQWHKNQIISLRNRYPGLGKDKLKILLDGNSKELNQPLLSVSTVGRLVSDLQKRGQLPNKCQLTMLAKTGRLVDKLSNKPRLKKQRRGSFYPKQPGELLQVDCVVKFIGNLRRYIISAVDYHGQFAFSYGYTRLSSASATDFLMKLRKVAPFEITRVQTDNGSEFYDHFHKACEDHHLTHYWNYPRTPQTNGKIERYNRTVQEEFADWHTDELGYYLDEFNQQLMDWLIWYNTVRPHWSLKLKSPMQYLLEHLQLPSAESNMLWTDTLN
jgi:transposase InsO family protein